VRGAALCLALPIAVAALTGGALAAVGAEGWPGPTGVAGAVFCEGPRPGPIKQPANTWSNLGFVAVAIAVGARARRDLAEPPPARLANPMGATLLVPALYASIVAFLGPGSMAMHASTTRWGQLVDVLSMYVFIAFLPSYGLARLLRLGPRAFAVLYAALAVASAGVLVSGVDPHNLWFRTLAVASGLVELAVWRLRPELAGRRRWLGAAVACFLVAYAVWIPSQTGGPLCDPDSWLQGHALWHLLCAGSAGCFYLYFRSERVPDAAARSAVAPARA
jgi:hypothetical protein